MPRIVCPKCGSHLIKKVDDKSKPMAYAGHAPVFKKINVCKSCSERFEWVSILLWDNQQNNSGPVFLHQNKFGVSVLFDN